MKSFVAALIFSAVVGLGQGQVTLTQCPDGWISWQDFCYQFFNNNTQMITWEEASSECQNRQGHLLRIETPAEYDFIRKNFQTYPSDAYWTALNDLPLNQGAATKATFMWGDDEFPDDEVVANNWDKEPDNTENKDCVQVSIQATLTVEDCKFRHGYICEFDRKQDEVCPSPWIDSYLGSNRCYLISSVNWTDTKNWADSRKMCESMSPYNDNRKARLISITDQNVQTFLVENLPLIQNTRQVYWTGLNDLDSEGNFIWTGNTANAFNASTITWRVEPNNLGGKENCGAILPPGGEWSDANCDDRKNYICRITLNPADLYNFGCGQWTRAGQRCVYVYDKPRLTYDDARTFCQSKGGDLYRFYNEDDAMWLKTQAQTLLVQPGYLIGLNDRQSENTFVWQDGTEADSTLLDWDQQPNNNGMGRFVENCAAISVEGTFSSGRCRRLNAGSVCEDPSASCMPGWVSWSGSCYLFDPTWRSHNEARDNCHDSTNSGKGHLLALNSQDEKDFVVNQLSSLTNAPYTFWTDLNKQGPDGAWHYTLPDDDDPMAIQELATWDSEPNDYNHNEDCVQVNNNAHLNDVNCAGRYPFICQSLAAGGNGSGEGGQSMRRNNGGSAMTPSKFLWLLPLCLLKLWYMG